MRPRRQHAPQQSGRRKPCMQRQVVRTGQRKTLALVEVEVVAACVALKGLPFTPRTQPHQPRPLLPARHRASLPPRDD